MVVVVVVATGFTHPTSGIVVAVGSDTGGHNTGSVVVVMGTVVVAARDVDNGDSRNTAMVAQKTTEPRRRILSHASHR